MPKNTPGTWDDNEHFTPGVAVTHTREHFPDNGPPFCKECSDAMQNWVTWPCAASKEGSNADQ